MLKIKGNFVSWGTNLANMSSILSAGILSVGIFTKLRKWLGFSYIDLKEAVSIFHENYKLPDELAGYIPTLEHRYVLDKVLNERDNPINKLDEELHWADADIDILNLLTIFFKDGTLPLYGSIHSARNSKKIPLQDIKSFSKDFSCIYSPRDNGKKNIKYKNIKCWQKDLLNFINKEKRSGGLLSLDSLKRLISTHKPL